MTTIDIDLDIDRLVDDLREQVEDRYRGGDQALEYGFGFVRVRLDDAPRLKPSHSLHVWGDELVTDDSPHSHTFALRSRVIGGQVTNTTYTEVVGGTHTPITVRYDDLGLKLIEPEHDDNLVGLDIVTTETIDIRGYVCLGRRSYT